MSSGRLRSGVRGRVEGQHRVRGRALVALLALVLATTALAAVAPTPASAASAPVARRDVVRTGPAQGVTVFVLGNDSDPDGDPIEVVGVGPALHGEVQVTSGYFSYFPDEGFSGVERLTYTIRDSGGLTATGTAVVAVDTDASGVGRPAPRTDHFVVAEGGTLSFSAADLLVDDHDPEGAALSVLDVGEASEAAVVAGPSGYTFTPRAGFSGAVSFDYLVVDPDGHVGEGQVQVQVEAASSTNRAPIAGRDVVRTGPAQGVTVFVLGNDFDPDGDPITVASVVEPQHGEVQVTSGYFSYFPDEGFSGVETISYTIRDSGGLLGTGTALVAVDTDASGVGRPAPRTDHFVVAEGGTLSFSAADLLVNDHDPDGQALSVLPMGDTDQADTGTLSGSPASGYTFTPRAGFSGAVSFDYLVVDPDGHVGEGQVRVQVEAASSTNRAPIAEPDADESPGGGGVTVFVLGNDSDPDGDPIAVASVAEPQHGEVQVTSGYFSYFPDAGFAGIETIAYTIRDSGGLLATSTVTVTVRGGTNRPPVAQGQYLGADPGGQVAVTLSGTDPDGSPLTYEVASPPTGGSLAGTAPSLTYTAPSTPGTYLFTFTAHDGTHASAPAAVFITVGANRAPTATDDTATVAEDATVNIPVVANDVDLDGDGLTASAVATPPAHGVATCSGVECTYRGAADFHGTDSFTYRVSDGRGGQATATVAVTVTPVNDGPTAWPTTAPAANGTISLTATDPDGDDLTFAVAAPARGTATPVGDPECTASGGASTCTQDVAYDQGAGPVLLDTFTFTASDGDLTSEPATVTVGVNTAPEAYLAMATTSGTAPFTASATPSGTDPDGDDLTYAVEWGDGDAPQSGDLPAAGPLTHTYTRSGTYLVRLEVSDGTDTDVAVRTVVVALAEPLRADAGDDRTVTVGQDVTFDGSNSRPTVGIEDHTWTFGDGVERFGAVVTRTFDEPGTYTAELAVTAGGDTVTDEVQVHVVPVTPGVDVTVTGTGGAPLAGADVLVVTPEGARVAAVTGGDGAAELVGLPDGSYTVYAFAPGYQPATGTVAVASGAGSVVIGLTSGTIGSTVVESRALTYEEIVAAGIDPNDPDNQHVYEFEIHLVFGTETVTHHVTVNGEGGFVGAGGGGGGGFGFGGGGGDGYWAYPTAGSAPAGVAPPINYLVIPGKARFLKEFFEVKLIVSNQAPSAFTYTQGTATLELPTGLSLAPTTDAQSLTRTVADVPGQGSEEVTWIVRGDTEGEYDLSVSYAALLSPLDAPVHLRAESDPERPLKVWAGSALEMIVDAEDHLTQYRPYRVRIGLRNVADVPVYNAGVELLEDGRVGYIYQPLEQLARPVAHIQPGETYWTEYALLPWIPGGDLLLADSFVLHTGGDVELASTIVEHPSTVPPANASATRVAADDLRVDFDAIDGAVGYDLFGTVDVETPSNGLQPDQAFGTVPLGSAPAGATSATLPRATVAGYHWVAVSVRFADGRRDVFHNLVDVPAPTPAPTPTATPGTAQVVEGDEGETLVELPVTLSNPSPSPVTLAWTVADRTDAGKASWADVTTTSGTLTIGPGETTGAATVGIAGDTLHEGDELAVVRFHSPVGARIGGFWGLGFIGIQDDEVLSVKAGSASVPEGDDGETVVELPVALSGPSTEAVTTEYDVVLGGADPGNADADDVVVASGTVTFAPGQTTAPAEVRVVGDTVLERNETVYVVLRDAEGAAIRGWDALGFLTVEDDDGGPAAIVPGVAGAPEGASGLTTISVPVRLSRPAAEAVTVSWETQARTDRGFASADDFVAASGTVTFAPGEVGQVVAVQVRGDARAEPDEYVQVRFHTPQGAVLGGFFGLGFAQILNDDGP